jgi:hypothetical protein
MNQTSSLHARPPTAIVDAPIDMYSVAAATRNHINEVDTFAGKRSAFAESAIVG